MTHALIAGLLLAACTVPVCAGDETKEPASQQTAAAHRVFELSTYYTNEGKLTDLHKRFLDQTCRLLKEHGAELIGFRTPLDEENGKGGKLI